MARTCSQFIGLSPVESATLSTTAQPPVIDYDAFLRQHDHQPMSTMRYALGQESIWVKCANAGNPLWNYRLLQALASVLRAPVLQPVPNPGGAATIATEVRRLRNFAAKGLRAPAVLAATDQAFAMRHLGLRDQEVPTLSQAIEHAMAEGPQATLAQWQRGLEALTMVHAQGECLSQAAARNMVCCPDGVIGYIDFEDDPASTLPLPVCHARDALNYAQSTALFLLQAGALPEARSHWQRFVGQLSPAAQKVLQDCIGRLTWARFLPLSRRLGRDTQRIRAAYDLLAPAPVR